MLTVFGMCLIIDLGWLELTLFQGAIWLYLLNGLKILFAKLKVTSRKLTILRFEAISILSLVSNLSFSPVFSNFLDHYYLGWK